MTARYKIRYFRTEKTEIIKAMRIISFLIEIHAKFFFIISELK